MNAQTALIAQHAGLGLAGPIGSFDAYLDRVSRVPVLSREREQELARRFRGDNDLAAARELVLSHLRFVVHIARGYSGYGLPLNDLVQEGNIGLMKAVKRFDPAVGVRLVSFAVHWIRAEIHEHVLRNWRLVKVATTKAQRKLFFNLRRLKKNLAWLTPEETRAVAKDLGVTPAEVTEMERRLSARDLPFETGADSEEEDGYGPAAYLPAPDADPADQVEDEEWASASSEQLSAAMERLDDRSRTILRRRWMSEDKATLHELADEYGVSAERIRQIEAGAITRLRGLLPAPA
ncbi:MAG: RNA polymerase sigma factor RpoH [Steroidobacteraceae bacterium]